MTGSSTKTNSVVKSASGGKLKAVVNSMRFAKRLNSKANAISDVIDDATSVSVKPITACRLKKIARTIIVANRFISKVKARVAIIADIADITDALMRTNILVRPRLVRYDAILICDVTSSLVNTNFNDPPWLEM